MSDTPPLSAPTPEPLARPVWIVGIVGHRTLGKPGPLAHAVEEELRRLSQAAAKVGGEIRILSSADAGTDLLALRAARRLGLAAHIILPLEEDLFLGGFGSHAHVAEEARSIIAEARRGTDGESVVVAPTSGGPPACYFDTDLRILEDSDVVLAVWDGTAAASTGGVGQTAALAVAAGKPVLRVHPGSLEVTSENFRRESWPERDPIWDWMEEQKVTQGLPGNPGPAERSKELKARLSALAKADAFDFRRSSVQLIAIGTLTGLLGLVAGLLPDRVPHLVASGLYAAQLVLALWVLAIRRSRKRHTAVTTWTNARIGAEIWRGINASLPFSDPLRPVSASLMPDWRRFALSIGVLISRHRNPEFPPGEAGLAKFRKEYAAKRIHDQRAYFEREVRKSSKFVRYLPPIAARCSQIMPLFSVMALTNKIFSLSWTTTLAGIFTFTILPAILPMTSSLADSLVSSFDHKRRSGHYSQVIASLAKLEFQLPHMVTPNAVRNLVARTEEILLSEQAEWRSVTLRQSH